MGIHSIAGHQLGPHRKGCTAAERANQHQGQHLRGQTDDAAHGPQQTAEKIQSTAGTEHSNGAQKNDERRGYGFQQRKALICAAGEGFIDVFPAVKSGAGAEQ